MGTRKSGNATVIALLFIGILWSSSFAQSDKAAPADTLTGDKIIAQFVAATGGADAQAKLTTRYTHMTIELMANLKAPMTIYQARPYKMKTTLSNEQIGTIERGYDGKVFWEKGTMTGVRLIEGKELADAIRDEAAFDKFANWKDLYAKADYVGTDTAAGVPCLKVVVYPKDSPEQTWYFDTSNGLLVKVAMTMNTQMGPAVAEAFPGDYRKIDGILMPFKITTRAVGMDMAMVVDSVAHNIAIPDSVFTPPPDVMDLVKQGEKK